jgi:hypothetical protein
MTEIRPYGSPTGVQMVDAVALFFWLNRDLILEKMLAEAAEVADDAEALTQEERSRRQQEIAAQKLLAERSEEAIIEAAERDQIVISRRANADPRAVLGLADHLPT